MWLIISNLIIRFEMGKNGQCLLGHRGIWMIGSYAVAVAVWFILVAE